MKNIHLLPTDKPSKIAYYGKELKYSKTNPVQLFTATLDWKLQNIYIISDEEIKEVNWCIDDRNILNKIIDVSTNGYAMFENGNSVKNTNCKKIILTTDQDLIKNGVQAIDDEFLEWFVKNPSCESVKVVYEPNNFLDIRQGYEYVIIIPKEETSKEFIKDNFYLFTNILSEPKQETIEEVAEKWFENNKYKSDYPRCKQSFTDGYNLAQQQNNNLYSEEDMRDYASYILLYDAISPKKWFEQFKKKQ